ncbi:MAG: DNA/RNA non-specific endonuclease [Deltaproteobacteria bacterium]|nr:DNA/RNA non-specific endonuclease [Deltaproteobacteria bacterium]
MSSASGDTLGFGTGFLVAPGVLMTNQHVIPGISEARYAIAEFDYELDVTGREKEVAPFELLIDPEPIILQRLDFCLVGVAPRSANTGQELADFGWLPLDPAPGKTFIGEYLTIIQHPGGELKQVCVRENKLLRYDDAGDTIWYNTDTVAGSSGSPAFNNSWKVVALHHSGVPKTDAQGRWLTVDGRVWDQSMDESKVHWLANEGIRISRIVEFLRTAHAGHPLAADILKQITPSIRRGPGESDDATGLRQRTITKGGEMQVTIPVRISVRVGDQPAKGYMATQVPAIHGTVKMDVQRGGMDASLIEKVEIDQSDYYKRPGYRPDFLGNGDLLVPLPVVHEGRLKKDMLTFNGKKDSELKYWNYSLVMNRRRKLAFFSAVNVDANQRPQDSNREGDKWFHDARIPEDTQIGMEFYGEQRIFEIDRSLNPFDRGHLVRRMDATWGGNIKLAKRNGNDTFHWTNCSPQHWRFNQGSKKWLGLEDYVIETFAGETGRACVINGPVFDAPLSQTGPDGRMLPNLKGKRHTDPAFGGVQIPKMFFKVVACAKGRKLAVAAFLMSQEEFLLTVERLKGMPSKPQELLSTAQARLYQVSVALLGGLTGLDFGSLVEADIGTKERLTSRGPKLIEAFSEIKK